MNAAIGLKPTFLFFRVIGVGSQINSRNATSFDNRNGKRKIIKSLIIKLYDMLKDI